MIYARDLQEFVAAPIGACLVGRTFVIWCSAPDLVGSIQWGVPDEQDVREMIASLAFAERAEVARSGSVLMDCRDIERVDADMLLGFTDAARERLPHWSARITRHAVIVPDGLRGVMLSGALPSLAPTHPLRFVQDLDAALAFLEHDGAAAGHAEAAAIAAATRGSSALITRLRAQLERHLTRVAIEECATALGISKRTLQRRLRELDTSFSDELRHTRISVATDLLRFTDEKIEAIASRVGFGSAARMSAALRRDHGVTARELRNLQAVARDK